MIQLNIIKYTKTHNSKLKHLFLKSYHTHLIRYIPSKLFKIFILLKKNYLVININHIYKFYPTHYPSRNQIMIINPYYLVIVFLKKITN